MVSLIPALGDRCRYHARNSMARLHSKMIIFAVLGASFLLGCNREPQPLTDQHLRLMSNSRYAIAYIDYHNEQFQQRILDPDEYESMRLLFRSLSPIRESRLGKITQPDVSLTYHGGMDPTTLDVKFNGDTLEFGIRNFIHVGGNAETFRNLLPAPEEPSVEWLPDA